SELVEMCHFRVPLCHGEGDSFFGVPSAAADLFWYLCLPLHDECCRLGRLHSLRKGNLQDCSIDFKRGWLPIIGQRLYVLIAYLFGCQGGYAALVYRFFLGTNVDSHPGIRIGDVSQTMVHHAAGLERIEVEMEVYLGQRLIGIV